MSTDHLLEGATYLPSENHNERPDTEISLVVIHNISLPPGEFGQRHIEDFFTNQLDVDAHPSFQSIKDLRVSAHLLIKRDGHIVQFVPFNKRAWHAGVSSYQGRENCNDFSIGIELEGDDHTAYEPAQYQALNQTLEVLKSSYPITNIVGHSDVAPGRKTDPGEAFDWSKLT